MTTTVKISFRRIILEMAVCIGILSFITGCSTLDDGTDNTGNGEVKVSLGGINNQSEETLTRAQAMPQTQFIRTNDSLMMECTLTPNVSSKRSTSAMTTGNVYRMVAYQSGVLKGSQVFIAGSEATTDPIAIQAGTYDFVFYSFNTTTDPGDPVSGDVSVPAGTDLLYYSTSGTVTAGNITPITVTFDHQFSSVLVEIDATGLVIDADEASTDGVGRTVTAATATVNNSYDVTLTAASGSLSASGSATTSSVSFSTLGAQTVTSSTVPIYVNGQSAFTATFSSITFQGSHSYSNYTATFSQTLVAGTRYTLTTKFHKLCGAYTGTAGTAGSWQEFLCWNLTDDQTVPSSYDPFTPSYQINGAYWKWGNSTYAVGPPTDSTGTDDYSLTTWNAISADLTSTTWQSSADPCPTGYHVPTNTEWAGVVSSAGNSKVFIGTWESSATTGTANFSAAVTIESNSAVTLLLPAAGNRLSGQNGILNGRGYYGRYWSGSAISGGDAYGLAFGQPSYNFVTNSGDRSVGRSIRCIAD